MNLLQTSSYESKRVCELESYNILDTMTEKEYEEVTLLASVICQAPIALISFVDKERQWFKSRIGMDASETERVHSFCNHAIQKPDEIMVVENARMDNRFQDNPFVVNSPGIVFYAGVPLFNKKGYGLGTICVIDTKPRTLNERQMKALKILSVQVMHLLQLRRINHEHEMMKLTSYNKGTNRFDGLFNNDEEQRLGSLIGNSRLLENLYKETKDPDMI